MTIPPTERPPLGEPAAATLRQYWLLLGGMVLVWLGCEAGALAGWPAAPTWFALGHLARFPFFALGLGGPFFLHFGSRPGWSVAAATAALGLGLGALFYLLGPRVGLEVLPVNAPFAGLGAASLAVLAGRACVSRGRRRAGTLAVLLPACLLTGLTVLGVHFLRLSVVLCPTTDDGLLYAADDALGGQLSFVVGRLFNAVPLLGLAAVLTYVSVAGAFVLLLILHQRADPSQRWTPLPVFVVASLVGYFVYLLFPAVGPEGVFGPAFPDSPPPVAAVLADPPAAGPQPRNCVPSLHLTWALFLFWHARPLAAWFRAFAGAFLVLTLLATLGLGQHYAIDLVVAFPFALAMQAAFAPAGPRPRLAAGTLGLALFAAWLLLLRFGLPLLAACPPLTGAAAVATVAVSCLAEHRLYRLTAPHLPLDPGRSAATPSTAPR